MSMTPQNEINSIHLPSNGELLNEGQTGGFEWQSIGRLAMLLSGNRIWAIGPS